MGSSPGFGSDRRDCTSTLPLRSPSEIKPSPSPYSDSVSLAAPWLNHLTRHNDQLAGSFFNRHAIRLPARPRPDNTMSSDCLWATGFRFSFTPRTGVLFTFPSRYSSTIGRFGYLALERGRPCFPRDSSCPAVLKSELKQPTSPSPTGLSPSLTALPRVIRLDSRSLWARRLTQELYLQPQRSHRQTDH